jgi:hypothetical protein
MAGDVVNAPGEKLARIKALVAAEDWRAAFSLAASFPRLGAQADAIRRAHEAMQRPHFQRQIKRDPEAAIAAGIAALKARYGDGA